MINRIVTLDTAIDLFLSDIDDPTSESQLNNIRIKARAILAELFIESQASLWPGIKEGKVEGNSIELPGDFAKFEACRVDNNPVFLSMQKFLGTGSVQKSDKIEAAYKATLTNQHLSFNVIGGNINNLHGKPYVLEYKALPIVDGELLMPENFVEPINLGLRTNRALTRAERTGKGITLWQSLKKEFEYKKEKAVVDVEFPSFQELIQIGKIWESKVPASISGGNTNNFNNF